MTISKMNSLHNARNNARAILRQRVKQKTEALLETNTTLRRRADSESSSDSIPPEENFSCIENVGFLYTFSFMTGIIVFYFFFV